MASGNLDVLGYTKKETNSKTLRDRVSLTYDYDNQSKEGFLDELKANVFTQYSRIEDNFDREYSSVSRYTGLFSTTDKNHDYYLKNNSKYH